MIGKEVEAGVDVAMRKYVIAALVFINLGLLSTIYLVWQRSEELAAQKQVEEPPAPAPEPPPIEEPEPPAQSGESMVIPDIFAMDGAAAPAPFPIPFQQGAPGVFPASATATTRLRREGTTLTNLVGTIRRRGSRYELVPSDGALPFILLENQLLQRVDLVLQSAPTGGSLFRLNGLVTEYLGENYLLLQWIVEEQPPGVAP